MLTTAPVRMLSTACHFVYGDSQRGNAKGRASSPKAQTALTLHLGSTRWSVGQHKASVTTAWDAGLMVGGSGMPTGTPLTDPPLIEQISEDPVLRSCKLIAEAWDCDGLNQVGAFPHYGGQWAEWNGHFRDAVRQFIKVTAAT